MISLDTLFKTAAANLQHQIDDAGGAVNIDTRFPRWCRTAWRWSRSSATCSTTP